jgi:hypothetical protein
MNHLSTLHLHQLRYGELPAETAEAARAHLAGCARCAARLAIQERERSAFEVLPVPPRLRPAPERPRRWWAWGLAGLGLAAAAAAALAIADPAPILSDPVASGVRPRGGDTGAIELWLARAGGARPWREGERLRTGDQVQLVIDAQGARRVTVGGKDGNGLFEVYGTFEPQRANKPEAAPFSLTLDDAPGPIAFYAVLADRPLADDEVKAAALRGVLPPGVAVVSITLPKE